MGIKARRSHTSVRIGVADTLFTTTQQRVFETLFREPKRKFSVTELIAQTQGGAGAIQREIDRLEASGILKSEREGRQRLIQLNRDCPVHAELTGIVRKTLLVDSVVAKALAPLQQRLGLAFVYGSVAKGRAHAASDIDLMIVGGDVGLGEVFAATQDIEQHLGRPIKPTLYTLEQVRRRLAEGQSFMRGVIDGPKRWIAGNDEQLKAAIHESVAE